MEPPLTFFVSAALIPLAPSSFLTLARCFDVVVVFGFFFGILFSFRMSHSSIFNDWTVASAILLLAAMLSIRIRLCLSIVAVGAGPFRAFEFLVY